MEIILKRLGAFYAPHWIQIKYFELLGFNDIVTLEKVIVEIPAEEKGESFFDNHYFHYQIVNDPNPHSPEYFYCDKENISKIIELEKEAYFSNDKSIKNQFNACFKKKILIDENNRINKFLIELIKEYKKNFPYGDKQSIYGKWCYNVIEIPDGIEFEIDEPEGCNEIIREKSRIWNFEGEQKQ